jgi:hypothetical protein
VAHDCQVGFDLVVPLRHGSEEIVEEAPRVEVPAGARNAEGQLINIVTDVLHLVEVGIL